MRLSDFNTFIIHNDADPYGKNCTSSFVDHCLRHAIPESGMVETEKVEKKKKSFAYPLVHPPDVWLTQILQEASIIYLKKKVSLV